MKIWLACMMIATTLTAGCAAELATEEDVAAAEQPLEHTSFDLDRIVEAQTGVTNTSPALRELDTPDD